MSGSICSTGGMPMRLCGLVVALFLLVTFSEAQADLLTFDFSGTLASGGQVTGFFSVDRAPLFIDASFPVDLKTPVFEFTDSNTGLLLGSVSLGKPPWQVGYIVDLSGTISISLSFLGDPTTFTGGPLLIGDLRFPSKLVSPFGGTDLFTSGSASLSTVPEPSTLILLGSGAVGFLGFVRRRSPR